MLADNLSTVDWILDRYFLSEEEAADVKHLIEALKVQNTIERIAEVLRIAPAKNAEDKARFEKFDISGFSFEIAGGLLPKINEVKEASKQSLAADHLGQIVQYSGLDLWDSVKAYRPDFLSEFLIGFKKFKAKENIDNKAFFKSMGAGHFYQLQKDHKAGNEKKPAKLSLLATVTQPKVFRDPRRLIFNKSMSPIKGTKDLCNAFYDHGLVKKKNTIKAFFNCDDQSGCQVQCYGAKRNHIVLLFDRLLEEKILVLEGPKGHWKLLENCLVDEQGQKLSENFTQLLSKLKTQKDEKSFIFDEIELIVAEIRK